MIDIQLRFEKTYREKLLSFIEKEIMVWSTLTCKISTTTRKNQRDIGKSDGLVFSIQSVCLSIIQIFWIMRSIRVCSSSMPIQSCSFRCEYKRNLILLGLLTLLKISCVADFSHYEAKTFLDFASYWNYFNLGFLNRVF